jgi:hypothetical protein
MTTEVEIQKINQSEGIIQDGFNDATGEYPKKEYFFGSSINAAARGAKVNELYTGGGDLYASIDLPDQRASEYPHNQVQETSSGHIIEIDDTPGGERVLIRHKTGSGTELRADGSVVYSSRKNKVEVVGADQTVIVEGNGKLIYKGNLDVHVTGDYNLTVGGNMAVKVKNDNYLDVYDDQHVKIHGSERVNVGGASSKNVVKSNTITSLGDYNVFTKGNKKDFVEGDIDVSSMGSIANTTVGTYSINASKSLMTSSIVSILASSGVIGGDKVDHLGSTYSGLAKGLKTTFYGSLVGTATQAIYANLASASAYSVTSSAATVVTGVTYTPLAGLANPVIPIPSLVDTIPSTVVIAGLNLTNYGKKNIAIDPTNLIKDRTTYQRYYNGAVNHEPNIYEIRYLLRNPRWNADVTFTGNLVAQQKISVKFGHILPSGIKIKRTVRKQPSSKFGYEAIGNNAIENRSKRFIPVERG